MLVRSWSEVGQKLVRSLSEIGQKLIKLGQKLVRNWSEICQEFVNDPEVVKEYVKSCSRYVIYGSGVDEQMLENKFWN